MIYICNFSEPEFYTQQMTSSYPSLFSPKGRLNITYPMLFKLTNKNSDRMTHCGVLEFVADEGICYLPHWVSRVVLFQHIYFFINW